MSSAPPSGGNPRVLILGVNTPIGLSIVRELRAHGALPFGIARSRRGLGLYSRDIERGFVCPSRSKELLTLIQALVREWDIGHLMAVSETDLIWLHENANELTNVKLLIPPRGALEVVLDKSQVYAHAAAVGIEVPKMYQPTADSDWAALCAEQTYPVVLKWADPNAVQPQLELHGIEWLKYEYAYNTTDLRRKLVRYLPTGVFPLVQSFAPGVGLGQMVFMYQGEAKLRFQHIRESEWPPEGGSSTVCRSVSLTEHEDLMAQSIALLKRIGWEGHAMVEYRYDPISGKAQFMEINGRFWGSQPLAYHAGAHFAWYLWALGGEGRDPAQPPYRQTRCVYAIPEIKRLAVILFRQDRIQDKTLKFSRFGEVLRLLRTLFHPSTRYFVFSWRDPLPMFTDVLSAITERVLKSFQKA